MSIMKTNSNLIVSTENSSNKSGVIRWKGSNFLFFTMDDIMQRFVYAGSL